MDFTDKKQKSFIIETNSRYEKIPYHDIYYIYKEGKNTIFVTIHGKSRVRMTLQAVYEKLAQSEFIYVDRGYIVNIRYVKKFQNQELCLINGDIRRLADPICRRRKHRLAPIGGISCEFQYVGYIRRSILFY